MDQEESGVMDVDKLQSVRLVDIVWEQVLCQHLLPHLSLEDLFHLRGVSMECRELVDFYFSHTFTLRIQETFSRRFSAIAFEVLSRGNCCLKELRVESGGPWLTDAALTAVLQNNPNLHTVQLSNCLSLTDAGVGAIATHCVKVRKLSLQQCHQVTGEGLQSLMEGAAAECVEDINLSGCSALTEDDLVKLAAHCRQIKYFRLDMMSHIRDRTVAMIARSCPGLKHLNVRMSWRLTDHSIRVLEEFCPHLEILQVKTCNQISDRSLDGLRARNVCIDRPVRSEDFRRCRVQQVRYQI